jgi:hypothetical protein
MDWIRTVNGLVIAVDGREWVYQWRRQASVGRLPGPDGSPVEILNGIKPLERFQSASLFPVSTEELGLDPADVEGDDPKTDLLATDGNLGTGVSKITRRPGRTMPPSAVGFSFLMQGDAAAVQVI